MSKHTMSPMLVIGRAGMDLYPEDNTKIPQAQGFTVDMGGSAGNIAVAMSQAGSQVSLISALSDDAIGQFVRDKLSHAGVDTSLIQVSPVDARTSLAIAEVRHPDCDVVIYRNNAADLHLHLIPPLTLAVAACRHLVITGTALIAEPSRSTCLQLMQTAQENACKVWFDLDYRPWNWPDLEHTRSIYLNAAEYSDIIVGNQEEFAVLTDALDSWCDKMTAANKRLLIKHGAQGSKLYTPQGCLSTGVYPVAALKPYGAGDAFLGNVIHAYDAETDWPSAITYGSAAASLVVAQRGCASVMPSLSSVQKIQSDTPISSKPTWR